jgi:hypothetical protein
VFAITESLEVFHDGEAMYVLRIWPHIRERFPLIFILRYT